MNEMLLKMGMGVAALIKIRQLSYFFDAEGGIMKRTLGNNMYVYFHSTY